MTKFRQVEESLIHKGPAWSLVQGEFLDPSGTKFIRTFMRSPGAVGIVALAGEKDSREVVLVRQYRPALGISTLEIPAGLRDLEGEDPRVTARRELEEEAGLVAATMTDLGRHISSPGISNSTVDLFLATDLTQTKIDRHGPEEQFMTIEYVPFNRAMAMVKDGVIQDGKTIIGLFLVATMANTYI
ncbi:MAG: NUDIX hydrolase [Acidimicrobiaceae bacterium]|nr:NUDIX hydrolase [Acidimicrobiaceae bacterium]